MFYTQNGSGELAGTRFMTPDETVQCHFVVDKAVCAVPGDHSEWPHDERADDGVRDMPNPPKATNVGWMPVRSPLGTKPKNWLQQGTFPSIGTGTPSRMARKSKSGCLLNPTRLSLAVPRTTT